MIVSFLTALVTFLVFLLGASIAVNVIAVSEWRRLSNLARELTGTEKRIESLFARRSARARV